jgi:uncharacterized protein YbcI
MSGTDQSLDESASADDEHAGERTTGQLVQVTRAMVTIYKNHFGRGPEHAHSHYAGPDILICVLENTLTPVERSLAELGEHVRLQDLRQLFQNATEGKFRDTVEEITGRKVATFMSANDVKNDVASEIFLFERAPRDDSAAE